MSEEEIFQKAKQEIYFQVNATDEEISQRAFEEIKAQKHTLPNKIFEYKNRNKKAIFMAGSSGAGKTEIAQLLREKYQIDSIDTDEIRKLCRGYSGKNSHLYQKASSKGVAILIDYAFKNEFSFILDGNFSDYAVQKRNIERAVKHNYSIEVNYIHRPVDVAKRYTKKREKRSGRRVPDNVFIEKSLGAIKTVAILLDDDNMENADIKVNLYDLTNEKIYKDISKKDFLTFVAKDLNILENSKKNIANSQNPYSKDYCEVPETDTDNNKDTKKNLRKNR